MHRVVEARDPLALVVSFLDRPTLMQARAAGRGWEEPALAALVSGRPVCEVDWRWDAPGESRLCITQTELGVWPARRQWWVSQEESPWVLPEAFRRAAADSGHAGVLWLVEHVCGVMPAVFFAFHTDDAALMRELRTPLLAPTTPWTERRVVCALAADALLKSVLPSEPRPSQRLEDLTETLCALADLTAAARDFPYDAAVPGPGLRLMTPSPVATAFFEHPQLVASGRHPAVPLRVATRFRELGLLGTANLAAHHVARGEAAAFLAGSSRLVPATDLLLMALRMYNPGSLRGLREGRHVPAGCLGEDRLLLAWRAVDAVAEGDWSRPVRCILDFGPFTAGPFFDLDPGCVCHGTPRAAARHGVLVDLLSELMDPFWETDIARLFTVSWRVWAVALVAGHYGDADFTTRLLEWPGFFPRVWEAPHDDANAPPCWGALVVPRAELATDRGFVGGDTAGRPTWAGLEALLRWLGREAPPTAAGHLAAVALRTVFRTGSTLLVDAIADGLVARSERRRLWCSGLWLGADTGCPPVLADMRPVCERLLRPPFVIHDPKGLARALVRASADPDPLRSAPWLAEAPWSVTPAVAWRMARQVVTVPWNAPCAEAAIAAAPTKRLRVLGRLVQLAHMVGGLRRSPLPWAVMAAGACAPPTTAAVCSRVPPFAAVALDIALLTDEFVCPIRYHTKKWLDASAGTRWCVHCQPRVAEVARVHQSWPETHLDLREAGSLALAETHPFDVFSRLDWREWGADVVNPTRVRKCVRRVDTPAPR